MDVPALAGEDAFTSRGASEIEQRFFCPDTAEGEVACIARLRFDKHLAGGYLASETGWASGRRLFLLELLPGVTSFFRDTAAWGAVARKGRRLHRPVYTPQQ